MKKTILLVDAPGYIHRAYHAIPPLTTTKGVSVNAAYGFAKMMFKLQADLSPTHIALCFDKNGRAGREAIYKEYKANRPPTASDLSSQYNLVEQIADVLNIKKLSYYGWEADDVIASAAQTLTSAGEHVIIVTSDKDFVQLISHSVSIYDPVKNKYLDSDYVMSRYGISPTKMVDYLALVGDSADNIPKVLGVGPKTAAKLLTEFDDIESIITNIDNTTHLLTKKTHDSLKNSIEQMRTARQLAKFNTDLKVIESINDIVRVPMDDQRAKDLFTELEFKSLLEEIWGIDTYFK